MRGTKERKRIFQMGEIDGGYRVQLLGPAFIGSGFLEPKFLVMSAGLWKDKREVRSGPIDGWD